MNSGSGESGKFSTRCSFSIPSPSRPTDSRRTREADSVADASLVWGVGGGGRRKGGTSRRGRIPSSLARASRESPASRSGRSERGEAGYGATRPSDPRLPIFEGFRVRPASHTFMRLRRRRDSRWCFPDGAFSTGIPVRTRFAPPESAVLRAAVRRETARWRIFVAGGSRKIRGSGEASAAEAPGRVRRECRGGAGREHPDSRSEQ